MIFTACVACERAFAVPLDESYLALLEQGRQLVTVHVCDGCGARNFVQHRRLDGETFGENDPRAATLHAMETQ